MGPGLFCPSCIPPTDCGLAVGEVGGQHHLDGDISTRRAKEVCTRLRGALSALHKKPLTLPDLQWRLIPRSVFFKLQKYNFRRGQVAANLPELRSTADAVVLCRRCYPSDGNNVSREPVTSTSPITDPTKIAANTIRSRS